MFELLETKDFEKIGISDISEKAGVSRNAVYRNFGNKENILREYIKELTEGFIVFIPEINDYTEYVKRLFDYLYKYKDVGAICLKRGLWSYLLSAFLLLKDNFSVDDVDSEYYYLYRTGGIFSVYLKWIESGYSKSPEEMTETVLKIMPVYGIIPDVEGI